MKRNRKTLGKNIIPLHYELLFEPNITNFTFKGKVVISLSIQKSTKMIKLNVKELTVEKTTLAIGRSTLEPNAKINQKDQELVLTFSKQIKGKALLTILFQGIHNERMYGFYHSKYLDHGKEEHLLTTQLEPANARAVFPCFDEPALKASFTVSVITDKDLITISNMPIKKEKIISHNKKQVQFHTTPKMSTYLLYLGIGKFKFLSTNSGKVIINIYTTPEKINLAQLPLQYTINFLQFFEKYFGIKYPLPKLDIIAIPDFASGAMENWGAITFREIALLGNENTSVAIKQNIAITIAHELAHQWFGNLVTMEWWDDLWLNESFATFMSYKAVHAFFPEWDLPLQYYYDTIADALSSDQLLSTHPINVEVATPGDVDEIFDHISYDKGGSVLHMLEHYATESDFRQGLCSYLKDHAYGNATKDDLWKAIEQVKRDHLISKMMANWITKPGYPLIKLTKINHHFTIEQQRFTLVDKRLPEKWLIPIQYISSEEKIKNIIFKETSTDIPENKDWIKLNYQQTGYYRVQYDPYSLSRLGTQLAQKRLSSLDAAGIEQDLFALTQSGIVSLNDYLNFVNKYCLNALYPLTAGISSHLNWLMRIAFHQIFEQAVLKTTLIFHQKQYQQLGWDRKQTEKNTDTLMRSITLMSLGLCNHPGVLQEAKHRFESIKNHKHDFDQNIKGTVYGLAAWQGNEITYNYFVDRYKKENLPEESRKLLRSIGMFQKEVLLKKALQFSESSHVRLQDSFMIPVIIASTPGTEQLIWQWTKANWQNLLKKHRGGTHMLPTFVHNLACIKDKKTRTEIVAFFQKTENKRDDIKMAVRQMLERIDINIQFLERNK